MPDKTDNQRTTTPNIQPVRRPLFLRDLSRLADAPSSLAVGGAARPRIMLARVRLTDER
jgi:hypothetical protein